MKKFLISKSRRLRITPFTSRIEKQGVTGYTVYNHMLLPTVFTSPEEEYTHLKEHVQLWDVSVQREIEISGKDSYQLIQLMTCRNLSKSLVGSCYYAPLVDANGNLINDPLIYKLDENKWRVCIADSDVALFAKGVANAKSLEVDIFETKINTLAIQGPKSFKLMEKVFGNRINDLKFFKFDFFNFNKKKYLISRSGFSKQGGFEIHIDDIKAGHDLYDYLIEIGKDFNLKPGCPNHIERIEGGLLSYGNDMDIGDNPLECGFDKYVDLESDIIFLGKEKLKKIKLKGVEKKLMCVKISTNIIDLTEEITVFNNNNIKIGEIRSGAFSPKFKMTVGIAMINRGYWEIGQKFKIEISGKKVSGEVCNLPFL